MTALLDEERLNGWLAGHPAWTRDGEAISRSVESATFPAAIDLVRRVADAAEEADHHPDMDIRWRTVRFVLSTHSAGGLTEKDLALAEAIDGLAG
jgi:4a-hydroxytetrahydrobiopterin dehydratase